MGDGEQYKLEVKLRMLGGTNSLSTLFQPLTKTGLRVEVDGNQQF